MIECIIAQFLAMVKGEVRKLILKGKPTMKKLIVWLLVISMMLSMVACGEEEPETDVKVTPTGTEAAPPEATNTPTVEATSTPTPEATPTPEEGTPSEDELHTSEYDSLKEAYADYFMIGTIYTDRITSGADKDLVLKHFNVITPENIMKPEYMQPTEGNFNFTSSNWMMAFAKNEGLTVIGHTLAWHQQSGNWLGSSASNREEAIEQLKNHIYGVAGEYEGEIYSWDVVNEAIRDGAKLPSNGDWTQCLRETQWTKSIGADYLELAFQFAHEAAPSAKLYYNDYNLDDQNKAEIVAAMVADFRERGIPIDGIGMQGHYSTSTSLANVSKSLERFGAIEGIVVSVTELDVQVSGVSTGKLNEEQELLQAVFYANLFTIYKSYGDLIERVTFWGYRDNTSWRAEGAPLLWDSNLQPKEAYYAVMNPEAYAKLGVNAEQETKQAVAVYGTPEVDGVVDDCWKSAEKYGISNAIFAWQGATGTVQLMWDENYLYALFTVEDPVLNRSNSNKYEQDSIEFFLDQNNCKYTYYDAGCGQYRSNYMGEMSFGDAPTKDGVKASTMLSTTGYIIELRVPLLKTGVKGTVMGFDAQINDANASGNRQSVMKLNGLSDSDYKNPSAWAEVTFQ